MKHGAIIILEGVDKTGKTTEAERLARVIPAAYGGRPVRVLHFGPPAGNPAAGYMAAILEAAAWDGVTVVDRMHWSNEVYQYEYRGPASPAWMPPPDFTALEAACDKVGAFVVLRRRDPADAVAAMDRLDYGEASAERVERMQGHFFRIFASSRASGAMTDWSQPVGAALLREAAARRTAAASRLRAVAL